MLQTLAALDNRQDRVSLVTLDPRRRTSFPLNIMKRTEFYRGEIVPFSWNSSPTFKSLTQKHHTKRTVWIMTQINQLR